MMAKVHKSLFFVMEELNVGLVSFSPMANSFLTGKYGSDCVFDPRYDYRSIMSQFSKEAQEKKTLENMTMSEVFVGSKMKKN